MSIRRPGAGRFVLWLLTRPTDLQLAAIVALGAWSSLVGAVTWLVMGWDKWRAGRRGRRVSESTLLGLAWLGGGVGLWLGMVLFRHKTLHARFRIVGTVTGILWAVPIVATVALVGLEATGH